jgi:hypothetical protein
MAGNKTGVESIAGRVEFFIAWLSGRITIHRPESRSLILQLLNSCNFSENSEVCRAGFSSQIFTRARPWAAPDFLDLPTRCEMCPEPSFSRGI